jgi:DNA mismatch repair ATPase MutS
VLSETSSHGRYKLEPFVLRNYMRLDAAAIRALNLMPNATDGARSVSNVYGRINATKTGGCSALLLFAHLCSAFCACSHGSAEALGVVAGASP